MKIKNLIPIIVFTMLIGVIVSCNKKNEYTTITPLAQAHFTNVTRSTYYVKNDPNSVFKIPIGATTVSNVDRKVNVTVVSPTGAVAGNQYTLPSTTVIIPAGKVIDSLPVKGLFAGYPGSRVDTLNFTITGGDLAPSDYNKNYGLILRKYCDVVLNNFAGAYTKSYDLQTGQPTSGPYATSFSNLTSTGATTGTVKIANFWAVGGSITVNLDWTDPANFKTSIPAQFLYTDAMYGAATITGVNTGTFSSCDNTFTFSYKVTVAAGSFGNFTTTIAR